MTCYECGEEFEWRDDFCDELAEGHGAVTINFHPTDEPACLDVEYMFHPGCFDWDQASELLADRTV